MNREILLLSLGALSTLASCNKESEKEPNILIIFTDDQGYNDLACYGSTQHKTPVMDQLHSESTSFSTFYAQPVSGASRSALLTGRYPYRSQGRDMPTEELTLAEVAKSVDYQTVCIGKWDLTTKRQPIIEQMANAQGFDYYYGALGANDGGSIMLYENNEFIAKDSDMATLTRRYTDKAIEFLREKRDPERPFLLYLAHTMMHVQVGASEEFRGKSEGGLYGDVVEEFDYETGRLLSTLEELGLDDNTIIIYTTDNGPWSQQRYIDIRRRNTPSLENEIFWGNSAPLREAKGSAYDGGSRVRCMMKWGDKIPAGRECDGLMATIDFMPTLAKWMGATLPEEIRMDGVDQSDMILGKSDESKRETYCYMQHNFCDTYVAIRDSRWKLLLPNREIKTIYLMDFGTNDYELYDLENDMSESNNLYAEHPEIAERLLEELERNK